MQTSHANSKPEAGWLLRELVGSSSAADSEPTSDKPAVVKQASQRDKFFPQAPQTPEDLGIRASDVAALVLRTLMSRDGQSGRQIAQQVRVSLPILESFVRSMRDDKLLSVRKASGAVDYEYELTDRGLEAAKRANQSTTYSGSAPVCVDDYLESLRRQSLSQCRVTPDTLKTALGDLRFDAATINKVGQAMVGGKAMLVHGAPGNGKTSVAQRLTSAYSRGVWIPRAVSFSGMIARIYDPLVHNELEPPVEAKREIDQRWIFVSRPSVVVGGELTLESFEFALDRQTGLLETPLQLKANCGVLVIDDFGRQRVNPTEILNRLIVPLESRFDILTLPNGRSVRLPFEQLLVLSTNLEPSDLVEEAFMRRIPYKIRVQDPSVTEFRKLFERIARSLGLACEPTVIDYLISTHYERPQRPLRFCHARDLLSLICNACAFNGLPPVVTVELLNEAVGNYFDD
ncbi:MAG: AAA family ATPase [Planctomycetota bacterium]|nr:MAG: AAA family ATPase [Planctomycetota bacterium]REJ97037.1 MAG: AAA family ATPase [Planctomycetota bacterium]REK30757.1 MAG: AAA family ATPase [Planctomycetota bacterium]REK33132.1 MAG: AAA family ATPase [Planctomycetota bacterium]